MLKTRAIEETRFLAFQGRHFSIQKKVTTKMRVILDISTLNRSIHSS